MTGGSKGVETPLEGPKIRHPPHDPSIFSKKYPKIFKNSIFQLNFDQKISKYFLKFSQQFVFFVQTREKVTRGFLIFFENHAKIIHFSQIA